MKPIITALIPALGMSLCFLAAGHAHAQSAPAQEMSIGKIYCQYLFSIPDREPDDFEKGYGLAIEHAVDRLTQSDPSLSRLQALMQVRQRCLHQVALDGQ